MAPPELPAVKLTTYARERLQELNLPRAAMLAAYTAMYIDLPITASIYRIQRRDPAAPNRFFCDHRIIDRGRRKVLWLLVGDAGWPDLLWVTDVFLVDGGPVS